MDRCSLLQGNAGMDRNVRKAKQNHTSGLAIMTTGSNCEIALATSAYCFWAGLASSRHSMPLSGHPIQAFAWGSNSPAQIQAQHRLSWQSGEKVVLWLHLAESSKYMRFKKAYAEVCTTNPCNTKAQSEADAFVPLASNSQA